MVTDYISRSLVLTFRRTGFNAIDSLICVTGRAIRAPQLQSRLKRVLARDELSHRRSLKTPEVEFAEDRPSDMSARVKTHG